MDWSAVQEKQIRAHPHRRAATESKENKQLKMQVASHLSASKITART